MLTLCSKRELYRLLCAKGAVAKRLRDWYLLDAYHYLVIVVNVMLQKGLSNATTNVDDIQCHALMIYTENRGDMQRKGVDDMHA